MYPRGDQLYLMRCVGLKGLWVEEARSTVSSFHSTHHCSLQHCTPRNNYYIVLRKWVHLLYSCFKASIFAHPLVKFCNRVGKAPSNTNDCCLPAAQTRAALVGFGANSSVLTAGLFPSQCCPLLVTPKQPSPPAAEENTEPRRSEKNHTFQSIVTVMRALSGNWLEWASDH